MIYLNSCTRCSGAVAYENDSFYESVRCLSCGFRLDRNIPVSSVPPQRIEADDEYSTSARKKRAARKQARAWKMHLAGTDTAVIARRLKVGQRTVMRYLQREREAASHEPLRQRHAPQVR